MTQYPETGSLEWRIAQLEKRLATMERSDRAIATSIGAGGMKVVDGGQIQILDGAGDVQMTLAADGLTLAGLLSVAGDILIDGGELSLLDDDGDEIFRANANGLAVDNGGALYGYDDAGNIRVYFGRMDDGTDGLLVQNAAGEALAALTDGERSLSDDLGDRVVWVEAEGLDKPAVPMTFGHVGTVGTTSAATYETVAEAMAYRTHPTVRVELVVAAPAGVTADIQLWDGFTSTEIDVASVTGSANVTLSGTLAGGFHQQQFLQVRGRVTAGAGDVDVRVRGGWTGDV